MNAVLKIDTEFESICPALSDEEYAQLEENILAEGLILMPLIVWDGTIIDGHNRYKIAQAHPEIEYRIHEKQFENRYEAISWICKNQLGRRNLTDLQKKILIGRQFESEKAAHGGNRSTSRDSNGQFTAKPQTEVLRNETTSQRIARENKVGHAYVERAGEFVRGMDAAETLIPGISQEIFTGVINPSAKDVAAIAKAPPEERRQKAEKLRVPKEKPTPQPISSRKEARQELKEIRDIYADMVQGETPTPASEDSILETLRGAVTDMIRVCDTLFSDFPRLLEDSTYKAKVIEIMQEPKQYILEIEGE